MPGQTLSSPQGYKIGSVEHYEKLVRDRTQLDSINAVYKPSVKVGFLSTRGYPHTTTKRKTAHNSNPMSSVTREEIAAQLAAAKAERSVDIAAIHLDMEKLRSETALALEKLRGDNLTAFAEMRGDMRSSSEALRADFHQMVTAITKESSRVAEGIAEVRGSVDGLKSSITMLQWVLATVAALAAAWIGYQQLEVAKQTPAPSAVVASPSATPAPTASKP